MKERKKITTKKALFLSVSFFIIVIFLFFFGIATHNEPNTPKEKRQSILEEPQEDDFAEKR